LKFDENQAKIFYKFLNHKGLTEIRAIHPIEGLKGQHFVDDLQDFLEVCQRFSGKCNVYAGVNERKTQSGKSEDVTKLSVIPIDVDPIRPKGASSTEEQLKLAQRKMEKIKAWLKENFNCKPFITMSGNGYHIYIKIPPITIDEFNREVVTAKLKAFINEVQKKFNDKKVRIDSTYDLPRVMKVPGTMSVKGDIWRLCKIIEANDEPCKEVREYLAKIRIEEPQGGEFYLGAKKEEDFEAILKKDPKLKDLFEGKWEQYGFPSRSEAEQSLLTKLVFYGFSEDAIRAIMNRAKIGKWREKGEAYKRMSIRKAIEFVRKHGGPYEGELKPTCGENLEDVVFEQIRGGQFIVYNKVTGEIKKQTIVNGFKPLPQKEILWEDKLLDDIQDFESLEKLWDEVRSYLWEHIDLREGYDILTAWVLASWTPERWRAIPYLFFYGPPGSGKTWALEVLSSIGFRPFLTASITVASLFRVCDHYKPTLFLDETETYMMKDRREIMNLLNSGYRKGSKAVRTEGTKEGGYKIRVFNTFGFKALSGTKELIETLRSRCIIFNMTEATRDIKTYIDEVKARSLRAKLLAYRLKMLAEKPEKLEVEDLNLKGRLRELFEPLIIVAPPTAKQSILAEAKRIEKMIREEQQASDEAIVLKAIIDAHDQNPNENKITIEEIVRIVNQNLGPEEFKNAISVGKICSKLGFKRTMKGRKRAIIWNQELARRLARKYYPQWLKESDRLTDWMTDNM